MQNMNINAEEIVVLIYNYKININMALPYKKEPDGTSAGTGFFISDTGYILTCAHVIENASLIQFEVPINGKKRYNASIVSVSFDKDIALLQSKSYKNTSFFKLGNSDNIKRKDKTEAIGYPIGRNLKYTSGIISGFEGPYIQTDTPINSGNSGGPLINTNGEVIGINFAKIADADNIGYAIPINHFTNIFELMKKEKIIYNPILLCEFNKINQDFLDYINSSNILNRPNKLTQTIGDTYFSDELNDNRPCVCNSGLYIKKMCKQSPFYIAGLRIGDIICKFKDIPIDNYGDCVVNNEHIPLVDLLHKFSTIDKVNVTYIRFNLEKKKVEYNTSEINFNIEYPFKIKMIYYPLEEITYDIFGGLVIMPLSMNYIKYGKTLNMNLLKFFNFKERLVGRLIIANILSSSYIKTVDILEEGDIIEKINGKPVYTLDDYYTNMVNYCSKKNGIIYVEIDILDSSKKIILNINNILKKEDQLYTFYDYGNKKSKLFDEFTILLNKS